VNNIVVACFDNYYDEYLLEVHLRNTTDEKTLRTLVDLFYCAGRNLQRLACTNDGMLALLLLGVAAQPSML
jgi:hypothetical protein